MTSNHAGDHDIWLTEAGWKVGLGGAVLRDREKTGYIMPNGTFNWGGYYATSFDIDFENEMIYLLFTQRSPYQDDHSGEFDKLRVLTHAAIVAD
jgi:CubicO group peptidase (beta-lactamase class C family)